MSKDKATSLFDELDSRLDDFFSDNDGDLTDSDFDDAISDMTTSSGSDSATIGDITSKALEKSASNPLDSLKAVVLEMDWEISDENLNKYLSEIDKLKKSYKNDRAVYLYLRLHQSIGKYMLHKKAGAHPEALKYLYSVFNNLEKIIKKKLSLLEKNKMILKEVNSFRTLKQKMFPQTYSPVEDSDSREKKKIEKPDFSSLPEEIQSEINKYIENEIASKIQALKNELIGS